MRARITATFGLAALACATPTLPAGLRELVPSRENAPILVATPPAALPAPRGLRALAGELRAVPLRWDPVLGADVAGYVVERAEPENEHFVRIAVLQGRFLTSYVDRGDRSKGNDQGPGGLEDGASYRYRVRAFETSGRLGQAATDEVVATTAPPPAPPRGLRAYSHLPRRVALTWLPSGNADVAGYVVSRSPSAGGEYGVIARVRGRHRSQLVDQGLGDLRVFYYRVASVNAAGGEGPPSDPVRAVTKAEPLPPVGLRVAEQRLGANRLAWDPNVERDIAGYRLVRWREGDNSPEVVATLEAPATAAWDEAVDAREVVTYAAVAFDRDGLESNFSEPAQGVSEGYELTADVVDAAVQLRWRARAQEGFVAARVLRARWLGWRELARVTDSAYQDAAVRPGRRYRYRVVLERADGSEAPSSQVIQVGVPSATGVAAR